MIALTFVAAVRAALAATMRKYATMPAMRLLQSSRPAIHVSRRNNLPAIKCDNTLTEKMNHTHVLVSAEFLLKLGDGLCQRVKRVDFHVDHWQLSVFDIRIKTQKQARARYVARFEECFGF